MKHYLKVLALISHALWERAVSRLSVFRIRRSVLVAVALFFLKAGLAVAVATAAIILVCNSVISDNGNSSIARSIVQAAERIEVSTEQPEAVKLQSPKEVSEATKPVDPNTALDHYIDQCAERIDVVKFDDEGNEIRPKKRRITKSQQRKMKRDIVLITREMGANPKPFLLWGLRESSYKWWARHRLNPDKEAAIRAHSTYSYSVGLEDALKVKIAKNRKIRGGLISDITRAKRKRDAAAPGTPEHQAALDKIAELNTQFKRAERKISGARNRLRKIKVYKDNPTFGAAWRWGNGYGLYGHQPVYFVGRWDKNAPPEILCDPIVATIVQVWSVRQGQGVCMGTGYEGTYEDVNRIFSSGHCDYRPKRAKYFQRRADRIGLNYSKVAQFGSDWPRKSEVNGEMVENPRQPVYDHMKALIDEADAKCLTYADVIKPNFRGVVKASSRCEPDADTTDTEAPANSVAALDKGRFRQAG